MDSVDRVRSLVRRIASFGEAEVTRTSPGELGRGGRLDVARAVSDAWGTNVAVLDARGRILEINGAWRRFGLENGAEAPAEGCDYFAVCEASAATEPTAAVVVDGLRALVAGTVDELAVADRVRQLGCELALDDFGTGYGGFTYLKHYPLDYLKVDIEFVRDAVTSAASRHVIESVVSLAQAFGLQTIAEGVEDDATLQLLSRLDVDFAQGFLLGRPVSTTTVFPLPERHHP